MPEFRTFNQQNPGVFSRNALATIQAREAGEAAGDRDIARKNRNVLAELGSDVMKNPGSPESNTALETIFKLDPNTGAKYQQFLTTSTKEQREQTKETNATVFRWIRGLDPDAPGAAEKFNSDLDMLIQFGFKDAEKYRGEFTHDKKNFIMAITGKGIEAIDEFGQPKPGINEEGDHVFFQTNKKGDMRTLDGVKPVPKKGMKVTTSDGTIVEMGGSGSPQKLTELEGKASNFGNRMIEAEGRIGKIFKSNPEFDASNLFENLAAKAPLGNYALSPEFQQYYQGASDWIRAKLRLESGAVIADEEMKREYETYFPQPGDSRGVIAAKAAARKEAVRGTVGQAGAGFEGVRQADVPGPRGSSNTNRPPLESFLR